MGLFHHQSDEAQAYDQVVNAPHKAELSHELLGAAASYEASKAYEQHRDREGKPQGHEKAKEIMAAAGGAFVDRMIETKGLDYVDAEKAKHHASQCANDTGSNY
ncbi:hypothetical protein C8Q70DRAFT_1031043 [Cubamyces menziesii]|uniref:Uncharacterized protein n=1 Tax=Trametes cubensis TaxID=1111947 RepID=A0AAD7XDZ2_9APHY|nr:hypothetical protein C8Q70DRAFT_1031043 [Cubamyces menziesii]KAJ8489357.1 hypothetical protein ONZ51_g2977 [Trametes cubensis]